MQMNLYTYHLAIIINIDNNLLYFYLFILLEKLVKRCNCYYHQPERIPEKLCYVRLFMAIDIQV